MFTIGYRTLFINGRFDSDEITIVREGEGIIARSKSLDAAKRMIRRRFPTT